MEFRDIEKREHKVILKAANQEDWDSLYAMAKDMERYFDMGITQDLRSFQTKEAYIEIITSSEFRFTPLEYWASFTKFKSEYYQELDEKEMELDIIEISYDVFLNLTEFKHFTDEVALSFQSKLRTIRESEQFVLNYLK